MAIREGVVYLLEQVPNVKVWRTCSNARDAMDAVAQEHFDLAMLDLQLGDDNGIVLGRNLLKIDPDLKVVNYTKEASIVIAAEVFRHDYSRPRRRGLATVGPRVETELATGLH